MFGQIDMEDAIAGTVFALSAAVTAGIATITILGHALSGSVWTVERTGITVAFLLSLLSLSAVYTTNRVNDKGADYQVDTNLSNLAKGEALSRVTSYWKRSYCCSRPG